MSPLAPTPTLQGEGKDKDPECDEASSSDDESEDEVSGDRKNGKVPAIASSKGWSAYNSKPVQLAPELDDDVEWKNENRKVRDSGPVPHHLLTFSPILTFSGDQVHSVRR
jgi:hypothetical protein